MAEMKGGDVLLERRVAVFKQGEDHQDNDGDVDKCNDGTTAGSKILQTMRLLWSGYNYGWRETCRQEPSRQRSQTGVGETGERQG